MKATPYEPYPKKIKVIDLLNKIANGEEPKKVKYNTFELERTMSNNLLRMYVDEEGMFFPEYYSGLTLNDEVEIIEEDKKIEKIDFDLLQSFEDDDDKYISIQAICKKIDEIIDEINKEKEGK